MSSDTSAMNLLKGISYKQLHPLDQHPTHEKSWVCLLALMIWQYWVLTVHQKIGQIWCLTLIALLKSAFRSIKTSRLY